MAHGSASAQSPVRTALAGLIGNVLEWFDYAVYGYFASNIASQFFPKSDPAVAQYLTWGTFALGFFARPIGSIVLGRVGDRIGRRALLTLSISLIGVSTLALGLLPTYERIGLAAPLLLMAMRMIQGFSLGGEFTGSMVYTTELSSPLMRGLVSSSTAAGVTLGFILGAATGGLINATLTPDQVNVWGWRIPFVGSVVFLIIGYLLRRGIVETEEGLQATKERPPVVASLVADWRPIVQTFGIVGMTNAAYYLTFTYSVERRKVLAQAGHITSSGAEFQLASIIGLFVVLFSKPLGGWLSDKTGRRRLMLALTVAMMLMMYPTQRMMLHGTAGVFVLAQTMLAIPLGMALGLQGAMLVEIFPLRTRVTSMSVAYSASLALAGGMAPAIATWLVDSLGKPAWPAFYVMLYGVIGIPILLRMKETNDRRLDQ